MVGICYSGFDDGVKGFNLLCKASRGVDYELALLFDFVECNIFV